MLVQYRTNKKIAYYDSNILLTVGKPELSEPCQGPFASCGECPYPSHGFQCYAAEGNCLKTHLEIFETRRKAEKP